MAKTCVVVCVIFANLGDAFRASSDDVTQLTQAFVAKDKAAFTGITGDHFDGYNDGTVLLVGPSLPCQAVHAIPANAPQLVAMPPKITPPVASTPEDELSGSKSHPDNGIFGSIRPLKKEANRFIMDPVNVTLRGTRTESPSFSIWENLAPQSKILPEHGEAKGVGPDLKEQVKVVMVPEKKQEHLDKQTSDVKRKETLLHQVTKGEDQDAVEMFEKERVTATNQVESPIEKIDLNVLVDISKRETARLGTMIRQTKQLELRYTKVKEERDRLKTIAERIKPLIGKSSEALKRLDQEREVVAKEHAELTTSFNNVTTQVESHTKEMIRLDNVIANSKWRSLQMETHLTPMLAERDRILALRVAKVDHAERAVLNQAKAEEPDTIPRDWKQKIEAFGTEVQKNWRHFSNTIRCFATSAINSSHFREGCE